MYRGRNSAVHFICLKILKKIELSLSDLAHRRIGYPPGAWKTNANNKTAGGLILR